MAWLSGQCGRFWGSLSACRDAFGPAAQCTPFPGTCLAELLLAGDDAQRVISSLVITLTNLTLERVVDGLGNPFPTRASFPPSSTSSPGAGHRRRSVDVASSSAGNLALASNFSPRPPSRRTPSAVHRCEKEPRRSLARPPARPPASRGSGRGSRDSRDSPRARSSLEGSGGGIRACPSYLTADDDGSDAWGDGARGRSRATRRARLGGPSGGALSPGPLAVAQQLV